MNLQHRNLHTILLAITLANTLFLNHTPVAHAIRSAPGEQIPSVLGDPGRLAAYWHDQRWTEGDFYACALYAQAAVLESFGYDFATELAAARDLGLRDRW